MDGQIRQQAPNLHKRRKAIREARALEDSEHSLNRSCPTCYKSFPLKNFTKVSGKAGSLFMACLECRHYTRDHQQRRARKTLRRNTFKKNGESILDVKPLHPMALRNSSKKNGEIILDAKPLHPMALQVVQETSEKRRAKAHAHSNGKLNGSTRYQTHSERMELKFCPIENCWTRFRGYPMRMHVMNRHMKVHGSVAHAQWRAVGGKYSTMRFKMVHSGVLLEQDSHDPELALHELASTEAYGAKKQFLDRVTEISSVSKQRKPLSYTDFAG